MVIRKHPNISNLHKIRSKYFIAPLALLPYMYLASSRKTLNLPQHLIFCPKSYHFPLQLIHVNHITITSQRWNFLLRTEKFSYINTKNFGKILNRANLHISTIKKVIQCSSANLHP